MSRAISKLFSEMLASSNWECSLDKLELVKNALAKTNMLIYYKPALDKLVCITHIFIIISSYTSSGVC